MECSIKTIANEQPNRSQTVEQSRVLAFRLSPSMRIRALELAQYDGVSLNHFISTALCEKLEKMQAEKVRRGL